MNSEQSATVAEAKSEAGLRSKDGLESVNRYNDFTWWYEQDGWTVVADFDCNQIRKWNKPLVEHEIRMWCDGYTAGRLSGISDGRQLKAQELRHALGL